MVHTKVLPRSPWLSHLRPASVQELSTCILLSNSIGSSSCISFSYNGFLQGISKGSQQDLPIIHIDLSRLNKVTISEDKASVNVQCSAQLGDVYSELAKHGFQLVGPTSQSMSVGRCIAEGGYSKFVVTGDGSLMDNVLTATVVLPDGRIVESSAQHEAELFSAIKGGANQFGIVAALQIKSFPMKDSWTIGRLSYAQEDLSELLKLVKKFTLHQVSGASMTLTFTRSYPALEPKLVLMPCVWNQQRLDAILARFCNSSLVRLSTRDVDTVTDFNAACTVIDRFAASPKDFPSVSEGALMTEFDMEIVAGVWSKWLRFTETHEECRDSLISWSIHPTHTSENGEPSRRVSYMHMIAEGRYKHPGSASLCRGFVTTIASYVRLKESLRTGQPELPTPVALAQGDEAAERVFGAEFPRLRRLKSPKSYNWVVDGRRGDWVMPEAQS